MNLLRNSIAVIVGLVLGGSVNMAIVMAGSSLIPPPAGVDPADADSIAAAMHLYEAKHFIAPFLAHALGTLAGALAAFLIAASYRATFAYGIGVAFLAGGITAATMIPAPALFIAVDLVGAYLPMAWLAVRLGSGRSRRLRTAA
ncbi:MAG: hypothetical protein RIE74_08405 [Pseudomonadales bacterium]